MTRLRINFSFIKRKKKPIIFDHYLLKPCASDQGCEYIYTHVRSHKRHLKLSKDDKLNTPALSLSTLEYFMLD